MGSDLFETVFRPVDGRIVHLVDHDDDALDAKGACELEMLFRLSIMCEASLKLSFPR